MALNFVVAPKAPELRRVGNEETGQLEVPVRKGLSVGESDFVADLLEAEPSLYVAKAKAADLIATAENITRVEALAVLEDALDGKTLEEKAQAIADKYEEQVDVLARQYRKFMRAYRRAVVAALIHIRLKAADWKKAMDDMDPVLFEELYALATQEQSADQADAEPPTEEELGKPPAASTSVSEPTGRKSSGR